MTIHKNASPIQLDTSRDLGQVFLVKRVGPTRRGTKEHINSVEGGSVSDLKSAGQVRRQIHSGVTSHPRGLVMLVLVPDAKMTEPCSLQHTFQTPFPKLRDTRKKRSCLRVAHS